MADEGQEAERDARRVRLPLEVLQAVFARSRVGYSVIELVDPGDPETWVIRANNGAASLNSQVDIGHVVGQRFLEAFPAIRGTPFIGWYRDVEAGGRSMELPEVRYGDEHLPDAAYRVWLEPLPGRCVLGQYVNVTLQRRAEGHLRALNASLEATVATRTAELRTSRRMLREVTYAAAHDLQTPVRHVLMLSDPDDPDDDPDTLELIHEAARLINGRLAGLLDYTEAGHHDVIATFDPRQEVDEVVAVVRARREGGAGRLAVAVELPERITMSRRALRAAVGQLVDNGLKFSDPGTQVALRVVAAADEVSISVADAGIGIAPEHHELIFQAFYRVHGPDYPGLGVGLSRARVAVETAGGSIEVRSTPGQGTTFDVRLPIVSAGHEAPPES